MTTQNLEITLTQSHNVNCTLKQVLNLEESNSKFSSKEEMQKLFNRPLSELKDCEDILINMKGMYPIVKSSIVELDMPLIFGIVILPNESRKVFISSLATYFDFRPVDFDTLSQQTVEFLGNIIFGDLINLDEYLSHLLTQEFITKEQSDTIFQTISDYLTLTDLDLLNHSSESEILNLKEV